MTEPVGMVVGPLFYRSGQGTGFTGECSCGSAGPVSTAEDARAWLDEHTAVPTDEAEEGACDLCGQCMIRTPDDCWHPYTVERAWPREPAATDYGAWRAWFEAGNRTLRPGREHFVSAPSDGDLP